MRMDSYFLDTVSVAPTRAVTKKGRVIIHNSSMQAGQTNFTSLLDCDLFLTGSCYRDGTCHHSRYNHFLVYRTEHALSSDWTQFSTWLYNEQQMLFTKDWVNYQSILKNKQMTKQETGPESTTVFYLNGLKSVKFEHPHPLMTSV